MSEVEKLFELAGIKPKMLCDCEFKNLHDYRIEYGSDVCEYTESDIKNPCKICKLAKQIHPLYPDFTAEKQIELIKWLAGFYVHINNVGGEINISTGGGYVSYYAEDLADTIALYINSKWNNLTNQERTEIKEILK